MWTTIDKEHRITRKRGMCVNEVLWNKQRTVRISLS